MGYFDKQGRAITGEEWSRLIRSAKPLRTTSLGGGMSTIRTIWIGVDHCHDAVEPVIFETFVSDGPLDGSSRAYATEAEALAGHDQVVARVREAGLGPNRARELVAEALFVHDYAEVYPGQEPNAHAMWRDGGALPSPSVRRRWYEKADTVLAALLAGES